MQSYGCQHCGRDFKGAEPRFSCSLHIFCTHLHKDIALAPVESLKLLEGMMVLRWEMIPSQGVN